MKTRSSSRTVNAGWVALLLETQAGMIASIAQELDRIEDPNAAEVWAVVAALREKKARLERAIAANN